MIDRHLTAQPPYVLRLALMGCALLAAVPCAAVNLAVNYTDAAGGTQNALRLAENGSPQPSFSTFGERFVSFATDAATGNLFGLGRSGSFDVVRVWDEDGVVLQNNVVDYTPLGLGATATAINQPSPDIAVHNGVVAINYSDATNVTPTPLRMAGADTASPSFSQFTAPASMVGVSLYSLDFDETGALYGLGQYAGSDFGFAQDYIRVWDSSGALNGADIMFDYTSVGMSASLTAGGQVSPDIAVHNGNIAVNFNDTVGNPKDILHLDASGAALNPYLAPIDGQGIPSATYLDIDYDHATGRLFGLGQYAASTFGHPEDFIGVWSQAGGLSNEVMFNFTSIGRGSTETAGFQTSPDLAVVPGATGGDIFAGDYNNDCVVDAADYTVWRDNLGTSVTLPNDLTPGSVDAEDYNVWRQNYGALKVLLTNPDGDFNNDGVVDAADYTVWRDNLASATPLPNDGGLGAPIDADHYNLWRANYGSTAAGPVAGHAAAAAAAPEPAAAILLLLAGLLAPNRRWIIPAKQ